MTLNTKHVRLLLIATIGCLSLAACSNKNVQTNVDVAPNDDIVARNLIYSLVQIRALHPLQTTVQMKSATSAFGRNVEKRLRDAGYGIQRVSADQGENYVRYAAEQSVSDSGKRTRYVISVGDISTERDYITVDGYTLPNSELRISGVQEQQISLNDSLFENTRGYSSMLQGVLFDEQLQAVVIDLPPPPTPVQDKVAATANVFGHNVRRNMFEIMDSNFADVFGGYTDVKSDVLEFPNDSMRLGNRNKAIINDYIDSMQGESDVLSIIGCSHGKSNIQNGNSVLALGRANRVKEAFLFGGLAYEQIFDEGCWAPEHFDEKMPRRGVVLTLKRKKELG